MNNTAFFDRCRNGVMGPTLDADEVSGAEAILDAMAGLPLSYCAYALATAWLETANSMQPVKEANWLSDNAAARYFFRQYDPQGQRPHIARQLGNTQPGDGVKYAGRGFVQITGRRNYTVMASRLGVPLDAQPDLALMPDIAAKIMRIGMMEGTFTGKSFADCLPANAPAGRGDFIKARRIINGTDRAADIAAYAVQFQVALVAGDWQ